MVYPRLNASMKRKNDYIFFLKRQTREKIKNEKRTDFRANA